MLTRETYAWVGDGLTAGGFSSREDAVESAAAKFLLTEEEAAALLADGWFPLGERADLNIVNEDAVWL